MLLMFLLLLELWLPAVMVALKALRWDAPRAGVVRAMVSMLAVSACMSCICVKSKRACSCCLPMKRNGCANLNLTPAISLVEPLLQAGPQKDAISEVLTFEVSHESVAAVSNESNNTAVSASKDGESSLSSNPVLPEPDLVGSPNAPSQSTLDPPLEVPVLSNQLVHRKPCLVRDCKESVAPSMWRQHMTLHVQGFFSGSVPDSWLQEQDLFVCPRCRGLVTNSRFSSHQLKCPLVNNSLRLSALPPPSTTGSMPSPLPTFEAICELPIRTVRHIPAKDRQAVALALSSSLRAAVFENTQEAWLKVFMLPKCILFASKRRGRHHKPIPIRELCDLWSKGHFDVLWNMASNQGSSKNTSPSTRNSGIQTAISYAREGLFSKACQALDLFFRIGSEQSHYLGFVSF